MEAQINIEFDQLVQLARQLPPEQWEKLKQAVENEKVPHKNPLYKQQLKKRFDFYHLIWKSETMFSSSISEITNHPAYRSIIGLGQEVIPFIINDLKTNDDHWFYALEALTGQNPIRENHKGIIPLMKNDWMKWAKENNLTDEI